MRRKPSKPNMVQMETIKPEPPYKGEPLILDSRTSVRQRATCKLSREAWEAKMREKFTDYDKKNTKARLTGGATVSSKLLKPTKEI